MKLIAAIFTLLVALLLLGAAYSGYQENARISSTQFGAYPDRFATRSAEGLTIQQAEEQGRLATAGLEGLLGVILLFAAVVLCGPAERAPNTGEYNFRDRKVSAPSAEPKRSASLPEREKALSQSGRLRIEELRSHRGVLTSRETPRPVAPPFQPLYPDQDLPG